MKTHLHLLFALAFVAGIVRLPAQAQNPGDYAFPQKNAGIGYTSTFIGPSESRLLGFDDEGALGLIILGDNLTLTGSTLSATGGGDSLPSQTGNSGKYLTTDGTTASWGTLAGGGDALTTNPLSQFAATTSSQFAGVISDETGSGAVVLATSPTLVTPHLGTPSALTLTNATGLPLGTGVTGTLPAANGGTGATSLASVNAADLGSGAATDGYVLTADGAGGAAWEAASGHGSHGGTDWGEIGGTPTTLAGYGITDAIALTSGSYADPAWITSLAWGKLTGVPSEFTPAAHNQAWSTITSTPTTLAGYGITDPVALTSGSYADPAWITSLAWSKLTGVPSEFTPAAHNQAWSTITSTPTTLAGYGITDGVGFEVRSADFTALPNRVYFVDDSEAAVTVTLPASPSVGQWVELRGGVGNIAGAGWGGDGDPALTGVTVARNGQLIDSAAADFGPVLAPFGGDYLPRFEFVGGSIGWKMRVYRSNLDLSSYLTGWSTLTALRNVTVNEPIMGFGGEFTGGPADGELLVWDADADLDGEWVNMTLAEAGVQPYDADLEDLADGSLGVAKIDFGAGTDGYVWTSDGAGGEGWEAMPAASGGDVSDGDTLSLGLTFPNDGLKLLEADSGFTLQLSTLDDISDDRVLTFATGDANRTLTFSSNATIGGTNSGDVTLAGSLDYLTLSGQQITRNAIDLTTDVTGTLPGSAVGSATTSAAGVVELATDGETSAGVVVQGNDNRLADAEKVTFVIACSDESTSATTGTAKVTFRAPFAFTLTGVRASVTTAPTGSTFVIDINESGTSVLSTEISIDATETTSTTAATPAVISDSSIADDAAITIDFDQVGATVAGAGIKVTLLGTR